MTKQITTSTEITFKKTKDIFELTQTETGFDVKPVKFSKNVPAEPWTFQELLDEYEAGKISIEGFEDADASHVRSILTSYIHQAIVKVQLVQIQELTARNEELTARNKVLEEGLEAIKES